MPQRQGVIRLDLQLTGCYTFTNVFTERMCCAVVIILILILRGNKFSPSIRNLNFVPLVTGGLLAGFCKWRKA